MDTCLFCKIIKGEIPAEKVYENDSTVIIRDIDPQAPYHLLALPRKHYAAIHDIPSEEIASYMGDLTKAVSHYLKESGLDQKGYRLVINSGRSAGQSVFHIHVHILGGRSMQWPPG